MLAYFFRRILLLLPILFVIIILTFIIIHITPGDPAAIIAGPGANQKQVDAIRKQMGLDLPLLQQFFMYFKKVIRGDLGRSFIRETPVLDELIAAFKNTSYLVIIAFIWSVTIAIPLGIYAAIYQNSFYDRLCTTLAIMGISAPSFLIGLVLIWLFGFKLNWLPISGVGHPLLSLNGFKYAILPAITLGGLNVASLTRITRSTMLEVLRQDYIRTARAKGLTERKVIYKHALKNASIPIVTIIGLQLAYMLGGSIVIESIFNWPGMGRLTYIAIITRDFPLIQGFMIFIATVFVLINLFIDLIYAWLDPHVRYENN